MPPTSYLESFFVSGQLVATREAWPLQTNGGQWFQGCSVLLFCPSCGDTWGRRLVPGQLWVARAQPCRKHGWQTLLAQDSEWQSLEIAVELPSSYWPPALVTYELTAILWELDRRSKQ